MRAPLLLLVVTVAGLISCSSGGESASGTSSSSGTSGSGGGGGAPPFGGDRPVEVLVPSSLKPGVPAPLVILLHGYSVNGNVEELYLQLAPLADPGRRDQGDALDGGLRVQQRSRAVGDLGWTPCAQLDA